MPNDAADPPAEAGSPGGRGGFARNPERPSVRFDTLWASPYSTDRFEIALGGGTNPVEVAASLSQATLMPQRSDPSPWRLAHLGLEFAGAAVVMGLIGWWIDNEWGTSPWGALIGASIGFTGGLYLFIKEALEANREFSTRRRPDQNQKP